MMYGHFSVIVAILLGSRSNAKPVMKLPYAQCFC